MATTITLPDDLEARLRQAAREQHRSIEAVVLDTLSAAFNPDLGSAVENVVAKLQAMPVDPQDLRPAKGSLADLLRQTPSDAGFDLDAWNQQWSAVEEELRTMTQADDHAEGRA